MSEKENPAAGEDQNRTHNEAPSEGDTTDSPNSQREHTQEAAEGDEPET